MTRRRIHERRVRLEPGPQRTLNYATLGAAAAVLVDGEAVATLTVYDTNNDTLTSDFDVLFNNGAIIEPTTSLPTTFFDKPRHQSFWGAYSSGSYGIVTQQSAWSCSTMWA